MREATPGRATEADWVRWLHARTRASEARRIAARPSESSDIGYARLQTARRKRAKRQAQRLNSLVLKSDMNLRAIIAEVRRAGVETASDAAIAHCVGDVCSELLAGAKQTENWFDEIVRRVVAKLSAVRVQ